MENMGFGWTLTLLGMAVTFLTLFILTLIIRLLSRLFPFKEEDKKE